MIKMSCEARSTNGREHLIAGRFEQRTCQRKGNSDFLPHHFKIPPVTPGLSPAPFRPTLATAHMEQVKDTARALVRIGFDGRVHKTFRGHMARERFENEVRVLRHLAERGCDYVPKVLETVPAELKIVTSNCGQRVDHLNPDRMKEIYDSLLAFGVRHQDATLRNITYDRREGRFCIIDFEFAQLLHAPELSPPPPPPDAPRAPGY